MKEGGVLTIKTINRKKDNTILCIKCGSENLVHFLKEPNRFHCLDCGTDFYEEERVMDDGS